MATERLIEIKIAGATPEPVMTRVSATGFKEIEDSQVRADLRTGDLLIQSAFRTPSVRDAISYRGVSPVEISGSADLVDLSPSRVVERIKKVVGVRGAVDALEIALGAATGTDSDTAEGSSFLNGDRDLVEAQLFRLRENLLEERRLDLLNSQMGEGLKEAASRARRHHLGRMLESYPQKS